MRKLAAFHWPEIRPLLLPIATPPSFSSHVTEPQHRNSLDFAQVLRALARNTIRHISRDGPSSATHWPVDEAALASFHGTFQEHMRRGGDAPLYAPRIEDLRPGEFVKINSAACHQVALLTSEVLQRGGFRRRSRNV